MAAINFDLPCASCRADLRGVDLGGACPRCGTPASATLSLQVIDPVSLAVTADVPCTNCGYNLRTLSIDGLCPECGGRVAWSLRRDDLRFADRQWVASVHSGVSALLLAAIGLPATLALTVIATRAGSRLGVPVGALAALVFGILSVGGILLVGTRDTRLVVPQGSCWPHRLTRLAPIVLALLLAALVAIGFASPVSLRWMVPLRIFLWLSSAAVFASFVSATICLRRIALRSRRQRLARWTTVVLWLMVIAGVGTFLCAIIGPPAPIARPGGSGLNILRVAMATGTMLVGFGAYVVGLAALFRYRRLLRRVAT